MMELCSMHDDSDKLSNEQLTLLYSEMMNFQDLKPLIIDEVGKFIENLLSTNDTCVNVFKVFTPKCNTFYDNNQNVHSLCSETDKVALLLINDYGCKYKRPCWKRYINYFQTLESFEYHLFKPTQLFAAVLNCIASQPNNSKDLLIRLKQEMTDSLNKCLVGYIVRLLNVFRGYIPKYQVDMDLYEQERAKAYLLLNKHVNPYSDDILQQIEHLINNKTINITQEYLVKILNAYTGESWYMQDGLVKH